MSSSEENIENDTLKEEREKAKILINETLNKNYINNTVKLYDPFKHGDIIIVNAEIIKKKKFKDRIKLNIIKKRRKY